MTAEADSRAKSSVWPQVHVALALAAGLATFVLLEIHPTRGPIMSWLAGRRAVLYPTAVSLSGTLLGFALASVTFAIGYANSERLTLVREAGWLQELYGVFMGALRAFALALGASLLALLFDTDRRPNRLLAAVVVAGSVLAIARLCRLLLVFDRFVGVLLIDHSRKPGS